jgi:hypothetical protein
MADEADDDGQGVFTDVKQKGSKKEEYIPVWRRDVKTYVYRSEVFTQYASDKWNVYFQTIKPSLSAEKPSVLSTNCSRRAEWRQNIVFSFIQN